MFRERTIITAVSLDETISRLKGQVRHSYSNDSVAVNNFSIHRSVTNSPRGDNRWFVDFMFRGSVNMVDGVTKITYRVTPPAILVILWVILLAVFVRSTLSVIFFHGDAVFLILSLLFPAALYGFTAWECSECVKDFESRLK